MAPDRSSMHCRICQKSRPAADILHGELTRGPLMELITKRIQTDLMEELLRKPAHGRGG